MRSSETSECSMTASRSHSSSEMQCCIAASPMSLRSFPMGQMDVAHQPMHKHGAEVQEEHA